MAELPPEFSSSYATCVGRSEKSKTFRVDKQHIKDIEQNALKSLTFVEEQLPDNSFLIGDYTLADVIWTVVPSRLDLLGYSECLDKIPFHKL